MIISNRALFADLMYHATYPYNFTDAAHQYMLSDRFYGKHMDFMMATIVIKHEAQFIIRK